MSTDRDETDTAAATRPVSHETLLDQIQDGVYFVDQNHLITYWNMGAERITGRSRDEVLGTLYTAGFLGHVDKDGASVFGEDSPIALSIDKGVSFEKELYLLHKNGKNVPVFSRISPIVNSMGENIGALEVFSDNRSRIQAMRRIEELEEMALLCPLTEVGNRRYAEISLRHAFEELRRYQWKFGVLFADIDKFKAVNDAHGHAVGDEILRMVAHGLRDCLRTFDFVGRWGGEEFIVLLPNITDELLETISERCRGMIEDSAYQHDGKEIKVTISIGAVLADPEEEPRHCVDRADKLMYASKKAGRNRITLEA